MVAVAYRSCRLRERFITEFESQFKRGRNESWSLTKAVARRVSTVLSGLKAGRCTGYLSPWSTLQKILREGAGYTGHRVERKLIMLHVHSI